MMFENNSSANEPLRDSGIKAQEIEAKDVDSLLALAEKLQCDVDDAGRRESKLYIAFSVLCSVFVLFVGVGQYYSMNFFLPILFLAAMYVTVGFFGVYLLLIPIERKRRRDLRALYSIVDMLREIESALAMTSNMSTLERAQFRIRLARFDIGPADRAEAVRLLS